ncbi:hypothetical protein AVEN_138950-1 [Araneus ventricosus]|uniref:Uncharacterized protein n=1 Tax=Araneus ventricosus TaxID=182803 RepID=A0A4Y2MQU3_ARAVE|nr:hypothetical protein AVEN_138950-1 [Araneus ventricosus]
MSKRCRWTARQSCPVVRRKAASASRLGLSGIEEGLTLLQLLELYESEDPASKTSHAGIVDHLAVGDVAQGSPRGGRSTLHPFMHSLEYTMVHKNH